jgi:preprotein translocase subunit SecA
MQQRAEESVPKVRSKSLESRGLKFGRDESATEFVSRATAPRAKELEGARGSSVETFRRTDIKVGRNDVCPCGSGKKYKNCHGKDVSMN